MTFFTFLPSFFFILPARRSSNPRTASSSFTAPLTGITAAVVGVIVNLAVFFALPRAVAARLGGPLRRALGGDRRGAGIALFRFKVGVIPVVLVAGLVGIAATFARPFFM